MDSAKHENMVMIVDPRRYIQVADFLRDQIADGTLRPGERLPSLSKLAITFGVGRDTVRHAVHILMDEGLVWLVHGLGYYVRQQGH